MADLQVKDTDPDGSAAVGFVDADNNPTAAADTPVWASSDESVVTISSAADGLTANWTKTGKLGASVISVDAHNDDGTDIHSQSTLTVVASEAVSGEVTLTPGTAPAATSEVAPGATAPAENTAPDVAPAADTVNTTNADTADTAAEPDPNQPL